MAHISDCRSDFIIALVVCEHVLQIIKQFRDYLQLPSHYLVQATVEAETIVKILHDERGDDNVYQALCVEADSPFHYWKFALYNVFVDNILEELEDQSIIPKPTFTAHLLIPTNMHKMAADDQLIIKHAYEPDINGDAFDMECRPWKARCSGEQNPPSTLTTTLDALDVLLCPNIYFILTVLLTIPVTTVTAERSFSSMKRIKTFLPAIMTDTRLSSLALVHIHRDFRVDINSVIDSFNEKKKRKIKLIWMVTPSL